MSAQVFSAALLGFTPLKVEIELAVTTGIPGLHIIGLPSQSVAEAKERIATALKICGIRLKARKTVVNLAPADIKKTGSTFDLAIAIGLLKLHDYLDLQTDDTMFFGELSLNGSVKPVRGLVNLIRAAKKLGFKQVVFPAANAAEARLISGIQLHPIEHIRIFLTQIQNRTTHTTLSSLKMLPPTYQSPVKAEPDRSVFDSIAGQFQAKRALIIAAAGAHPILLVGPPGVGKTMLASRLVRLLPPLQDTQLLEVVALHSLIQDTTRVTLQAPFRAPHHSISLAGLLGGGHPIRPGEVSLAHQGVLFLDELLEFPRNILEALRQPLEQHSVTINRADQHFIFPCQFQLVAAANPCPCGFLNVPDKLCQCTPADLQRYQKKLSGPLLDRIDLTVSLEPVPTHDLSLGRIVEDIPIPGSDMIYQARKKQQQRFVTSNATCNADALVTDLKKYCRLTSQAESLLTQASQTLQLSARGYYKVIKVAQTICDLTEKDLQEIQVHHIQEALQYRQYHTQTTHN